MLKRAVIGVSLTGGLFLGGPALSSVMGNGGASEVTQIMNNIELIIQNAQTVEAYVRQGMQYDTQLRNLIKNPTSIMGPEVGALLKASSNLMNAGKSIGGTMADVDRRLGEKYGDDRALTFAQRFQNWTSGSSDSLSNSMRAAGMRRDQYKSDADALQALYDKKNSADGAVSAIQTVADINLEGTKQLMKLGDMLAEQHTAVADYMKGNLAKEDASLALQQKIRDREAVRRAAMTDDDTPPSKYEKRNFKY